MLLPHIKLFQTIERVLELVSLPHFLHDFWREIFLLLYSINWPNFIFWLLLLREILGNLSIVIICWLVCDVIDFEINLIFLTKPFLQWPKNQDKNLNFLWMKRAFKIKYKTVFIIFKVLSLKQMKNYFGRWEPNFKIEHKISLIITTTIVTTCSYHLQMETSQIQQQAISTADRA